jgi:MFS superfamily sulfate permease-like transporter
MASWKESKSGTAEVEFQREDLMFSNISYTKNVLSEVRDYKLVSITLCEGHMCDGSGLQLLLYFIREIRQKGGVVDFDPLSDSKGGSGKSEWERILTIFGIQDLTLCTDELVNGTGER